MTTNLLIIFGGALLLITASCKSKEQKAAEDYMKQLVAKDPNLNMELHIVSEFEVEA